MSIEERIFQRKRFIANALLRYGFFHTNDGYTYSETILNGEFKAILFVTEQGRVSGRVIDCVNDEEYIQLRIENFNGAYVNSVRSEYEDFLNRIAAYCCCDVYFVSDQANRITETIRKAYGVLPDFPWGRSPHEHSGTFRHADTGKWFALIMHIRRNVLFRDKDDSTVDAINLKIDPNHRERYLQTKGVCPAYHMNHEKWITVVLDDTLTDRFIMDLIQESYSMTQDKKRKSIDKV